MSGVVLRRSARIAAQANKFVEEEEPVEIVPKVKRMKQIVIMKKSSKESSESSGNNAPVKEKNYDFMTLEWIQQFRQELSNVNNNPLEASEHLKVLRELIKPFPPTYGGLDDWFGDVVSKHLWLSREPENDENYDSIRWSINLCYEELEKFEKKISNAIDLPKDYYYPPLVRSPKCKERMLYMDSRVREFFELCEQIGIKTFFNIAESEFGWENPINNQQIFENYLYSVTEYREEGHFVRKIYGDLDEDKRNKIMETFGKEYCIWDGEPKYKKYDFVVLLVR